MFYFSVLSAGFLCLSLCACTTAPIKNIHDPANTYTPENTYHKEVDQYPFIQIASQTLPDGVVEFKNLTYVKYPKRELQLDLYAPAFAAQPDFSLQQLRPAIVLVHGGGWRAGYRENLTPLAQALALQGYVAATISYRLAPEAKYPAAIHDVKAAIRWLRINAKRYGVDVNHIAIAGGSAGGQIASLTGVTNGMEKFDPQAAISDVSSAVQAIINIDGLSDFTSEEARKYEDDPRKNPSSAGLWFGGNYAEKTTLWHEASPINYVQKNTPPILFIKSSRARFSVGQAEMSELMAQQGVHYEVKKFPDAPHSFWLFDPWMKPTAKLIADFLDKQF